MKPKKKIRLSPQDLWDPVAIQNWLEWEAQRGWRITNWNGWFCTFQQAEPKVCRVRMQAHGPESREAWKERIAIYEEMGWQYATTLSWDFGVYYCDDPTVPELDTDPVVYAMAWKDTIRNGWLAGFGMLAVTLFFMVLMPCVNRKSFVEFLMRADFRQLFTEFLLGPILIVMALRQIRRASKARKALAVGVMPSDGNWRRSRNWWRTFAILMLCWFLITPAVDLIWSANTEPDTTGLPYVSCEELVPDTKRSDWFFEWEEYANSCRYFAPTRRASLFSLDDHRVRNTADRLRFVWLAEMRYEELLDEFLKDCPEVEQMQISNSAFDEAVLLSGAGDEQMLLLRTGTKVYSLWVNFPVELEPWVEVCASEMVLSA